MKWKKKREYIMERINFIRSYNYIFYNHLFDFFTKRKMMWRNIVIRVLLFLLQCFTSSRFSTVFDLCISCVNSLSLGGTYMSLRLVNLVIKRSCLRDSEVKHFFESTHSFSQPLHRRWRLKLSLARQGCRCEKT